MIKYIGHAPQRNPYDSTFFMFQDSNTKAITYIKQRKKSFKRLVLTRHILPKNSVATPYTYISLKKEKTS